MFYLYKVDQHSRHMLSPVEIDFVDFELTAVLSWAWVSPAVERVASSAALGARWVASRQAQDESDESASLVDLQLVRLAVGSRWTRVTSPSSGCNVTVTLFVRSTSCRKERAKVS